LSKVELMKQVQHHPVEDICRAQRRGFLRAAACSSMAMLTPWLTGCGGSSDASGTQSGAQSGTDPPSGLDGGTLATSPYTLVTDTVASGLDRPWGLAFLPDGRMLVTERSGQMQLLSADGSRRDTVWGLPPVMFSGQGGLLDVVLDPDFNGNARVYWTFSEPDPQGSATSAAAVGRGRLVNGQMEDATVIFRQTPLDGGNGHYGARLAFRLDSTLLVALGERQRDNPSQPGTGNAQALDNYLGKVVRLRSDGTFPSDNPSLGSGALPGIWTWGHRNPQGLAVHPTTGEAWLNEHGPQGGDELNRLRPGRNYGWPLRSYGCPYGDPVGEACRVAGGTHAPDYEEPVSVWVPESIAPSSLMFYTGTRFAVWQGHAFMTALATSDTGGRALWRIELDGAREVARERLLGGLDQRLRCVQQGPDGWLYVLTDSGSLLRVRN
jgi:glucose/arabinose dehydrogenase